MKYAIYEDPVTHQFAHLPLPNRFLAGDTLPSVVADRWFETHEAAIAALPELLDRDDKAQSELDSASEPPIPASGKGDVPNPPGSGRVH